MKKYIIDTDTGSDDAVAIIMALKNKDIEVVAFTTVAGNIPLEKATRNCLVSIEQAATYTPPVYAGCSMPMMRAQVTAENVHGEDGLSGFKCDEPKLKTESEHAVDAIIRILEEADAHEISLITLGPLTNIATAFIKAPNTMRKLKEIVMMGGQLEQPGNASPVAEFNIYVDAEAASIVMEAGIPFIIAPVELCAGEGALTVAEQQEIINMSELGRFAMECNAQVIKFDKSRTGLDVLELADPTAMAVALYEDCRDEMVNCYICVETKSELCYGQIIYDYYGQLGKEPNGWVCKKLGSKNYKKYLRGAVK